MSGIFGLDSFIEGRNHPDNPANQTDWSEEYEVVLQYCDFIPQEIYDNWDKISVDADEFLCEMINKAVNHFINEKHYYSSREKYDLIRKRATYIAQRFKDLICVFLSESDKHKAELCFKFKVGRNKYNKYLCKCGFEKLCITMKDAKSEHDKYVKKMNKVRKELKKILEF